MHILLIIVGLLFASTIINKLLWKEKITAFEMLSNFASMLLLLGIFWVVSISYSLGDREIINGQVVGKNRETVSCRHAYPCNCHQSCSGSGANRSCAQRCSTCYRHLFDYDWVVKSDIGDFLINTLDQQGLREPPRYREVKVGDPVAKEHSFENYIKGSQNSIFGKKITLTKDELKQLPEYPGSVFDYYKINRVIDQSSTLSKEELASANQKLSEILKDLGPRKQVNAVIILSDKTEQFALNLIENWLGGKKNDVIIIVGLSGKEIVWTRVHSWSMHNIFDVKLRDSILDLKNFDMSRILEEMQKQVEADYARRSFKEFEYLRWQILPSTFSLLLFIILSLICSTKLGQIFSRKDFSLKNFRQK